MPTVEPTSQAEIVAQRLSEVGMSVAQFAHALEVQPSFIYSVMKGQRRLTRQETVEKAAHILGIPADALYGAAGHLPPDAWTIIQRRPEMVQALRMFNTKLDREVQSVRQ